MVVKEILEALKGITNVPTIPTRHLLAALVVLFCIRDWEQGQPYIMYALLVAAICTLARVFGIVGAWGTKKYKMLKDRRAMEKRILSLTIPEKKVLGKYIEDQTTVLKLDFRNPVVMQLVREGILTKLSMDPLLDNVSSFYTGVSVYSVTIKPAVWEYLNGHRYLLAIEDATQSVPPAEWE